MNLNFLMYWHPGPIPCLFGCVCMYIYVNMQESIRSEVCGWKNSQVSKIFVSFRSGIRVCTPCCWESAVRALDYFWSCRSHLSYKLYWFYEMTTHLARFYLCPQIPPQTKTYPTSFLPSILRAPASFHGVSFFCFGLKVWLLTVTIGLG